VALGATHVPQRVDEQGQKYACTADDSAYAIFQLRSGVPVQFNSSWCVRVRRDDLLTLQVDGTHGTAVAGLRKCWIQSADDTVPCGTRMRTSP
jgi:predicted dehydrogenase